MPGPIQRKPNPGDPLAFSAAFVGHLVDLVAERLQQKSGGDVELPFGDGYVRVRRVSGSGGAATPPGHVVALGASAVTPDTNRTTFRRQPVLNLLSSFSEPAEPPFWGVLLDPLIDETNAVARVQIGGVAAVALDVVDENDRFAVVKSGSTKLESNWYGTARILWKETGTGEKLAYVQFPYFGPIKFLGKNGGSEITAGGSGTVTVYKPDGTVLQRTTGDEAALEDVTVTAHHPPDGVDPVAANAWVQCESEIVGGKLLVDVEYCEASS